MDSVIKMVLDSNWVDLGKFTEQKASDKLQQKLAVKKSEIVDRMNAGYDKELPAT